MICVINQAQPEKVTVLGAGSWGTALANVLIENGHDVLLWTRSSDQAQEINQEKTNHHYLKDTHLPDSIQATSDLAEAVDHSEILLFVVPTSAIRPVARDLAGLLTKEVSVIHAAKGLEGGSYLRISQILAQELPADLVKGIVALSGPSHAEEVVKHDLTSITAASENPDQARFTQKLFINDYFRVYTNPDIIGVEIGAALKNIIALGSGIIDGYGYGDNARAGLITRGLAEISRLGQAIGAQALTFIGLSGVGDLIVTCSSPHSRNYQAGRLLGQGQDLESALDSIGMVVEGVYTTQAAYDLSQKMGIEMPITEAIYQILYDDLSVGQAITSLMNRRGKSEA